ncbi:hypothetical protein XJ28_27345 [Pseudomonas syringae pv. tomato]|nr:hypothetical protein XJ28_27345 [Pseudomonas syringae pv. tomato]
MRIPEEIRELTAAAVITQTLIELVSELIYIRVIPVLVWRKMQLPSKHQPNSTHTTTGTRVRPVRSR